MVCSFSVEKEKKKRRGGARISPFLRREKKKEGWCPSLLHTNLRGPPTWALPSDEKKGGGEKEGKKKKCSSPEREKGAHLFALWGHA